MRATVRTALTLALVAISQAAWAQTWCPQSTMLDCPQGQPCRQYKPNIGVHIIGEQNDLIEIWDYKNMIKVFTDQNQMRQSMGRGKLSCDEVHWGSYEGVDLVAIVAGQYRDIVHAYAITRDKAGMPTGVQRAIVRLRDGDNIRVGLESKQPDVWIVFGREKDLRQRLCFGPRPGANNKPYTEGLGLVSRRRTSDRKYSSVHGQTRTRQLG
jgi:hypothetical protein